MRWRRLAIVAAAATIVLSTAFSGQPAHAAELSGAPSGPVDPTTYTRFEQIIDRWAINIGFTLGDKSDGANAQTWSYVNADDANNQWHKQYTSPGYYTYRNRWSGKCLGVESWVIFARVEQQTCDSHQAGQIWIELPAGSYNGRSAYKIKSAFANAMLGGEWVLTVPNTGKGAPVTLGPSWLSSGDTTQRWFQTVIRDD